MSTKTDILQLASRIRDADVVVDADVRSGGLRNTRRQLAQVEFDTRSACRTVTVFMTAGGKLNDIIIAEGALDEIDHERMAAIVLRTIQEAEHIMVHALTLVAERALGGANR